MKPAGIKKIFERSEDKRKLKHTEYYQDGDSKGFAEVQNTYQGRGVIVQRKECIGYVQRQ